MSIAWLRTWSVLPAALAASLLLASCSESDEPETPGEAPAGSAAGGPDASAPTAEAPPTATTPPPSASTSPAPAPAPAPAPSDAPRDDVATTPPPAADCGGYDFAAEFFAAYTDLTPLTDTTEALENITSIADGECQQDRFLAMMAAARGAPIGLKVGLVTKASQEQFGVTAPLVGVMFDGMMREDGATIAVDSGVLLGFEADILARVKSAAINDAQTPAGVLEHIDAIIPFIEVPDLMISGDVKLSGPLIIAMNVAPRYGVMGDAVPVENNAEWIDALGTMEVTLTDADGAELVRAEGLDLGGHPLSTALYLVGQASRRGWRLEEGDLISLGSFGAMQPARPGVGATLTYDGLPGGPASVSVSFE